MCDLNKRVNDSRLNERRAIKYFAELGVMYHEDMALIIAQQSAIESLTAQLEDSQYCLEHMTNSYNAGIFEAADLRAKLEEAKALLRTFMYARRDVESTPSKEIEEFLTNKD